MIADRKAALPELGIHFGCIWVLRNQFGVEPGCLLPEAVFAVEPCQCDPRRSLVGIDGQGFLQAFNRFLKRLMKTVPGVTQVFSARDSQPKHDLQAPLAGLIRILGPKLEMNLAYRSPHLAPALETDSIPLPDRSEKIRIGFAGVDSDPNSILCDRPLDLALWAPLLNVEGCKWVNLQSSNTPDNLPDGLNFRGLPTKYPDFLDAASVIQELDLIIAVDCPVAHLAAAMEKPVWLILPALTDWKWATKRGPDSWYPTMRLFLESETEGRRRLISELAACLSALISPVPDVEETNE